MILDSSGLVINIPILITLGIRLYSVIVPTLPSENHWQTPSLLFLLLYCHYILESPPHLSSLRFSKYSPLHIVTLRPAPHVSSNSLPNNSGFVPNLDSFLKQSLTQTRLRPRKYRGLLPDTNLSNSDWGDHGQRNHIFKTPRIGNGIARSLFWFIKIPLLRQPILNLTILVMSPGKLQ